MAIFQNSSIIFKLHLSAGHILRWREMLTPLFVNNQGGESKP